MHDERGFTLVELVLTTFLGAIIATAGLAVLVRAERKNAEGRERANAIHEAQVGLYAMTKELRLAHDVIAISNDGVEVEVRRNGATRRVRYSCVEPHPSRAGLSRCVRYENGTSRIVIDRLLNGASRPANERVFQFTPNGSYVRAQIRVPAAGERTRSGYAHSVVLDDGFYMRNCDAGC